MVLDGDACTAVVPYIRDGVTLAFSDFGFWHDIHERRVYFVDATPRQNGLLCAGCDVPPSAELPIYLADYVAP